MWTYKTFFARDTEFFEYDPLRCTGAAATEKMFPFLESLLRFLEMDLSSLTPMIEDICKDWNIYFSNNDIVAAERAMGQLCSFGQKHVYFQLEYLHWFTWYNEHTCTPEQVNELRLLPVQLIAYQKQAQQYIDCVLDIDKVGRETQKNAAANQEAFPFQPIPVSFGEVDSHVCGSILYPNSIRDIIDFTLRTCVTRGIPLRRCKNCGRYFPLLGRVTAEYCSRPSGNRRPCRDAGAALVWTKAQDDNATFREYRREYKRRFAWRKAGKITEDAFAVWCNLAKAKKQDCDNEKITLEEFKAWLKDS